MDIISVTGTKGKTTVVNLLAQLFYKAGAYDQVLHVNTTGHFINGKRKSTLDDSVALTGLVPTVAPGRYLHTISKNNRNCLSVLESSLGCSSVSGMGYSRHNVGIFLNVYEDHLGSSSRLKTRNDIFKAKAFIFERIKNGGWAVLNIDDEYVMKAYDFVSNSPRKQNILLYGLAKATEVSKKFPKSNYVTIENDWVVFCTARTKTRVVEVKKVSWTFGGVFVPSLYNLMAVTAGAIAMNNGTVMRGLKSLLEGLSLPPDGGRLTLFKAKNGALVIADYAHEKKSLIEVAKLAHALKTGQGKVFGIVRLAYDRTDKLIDDTGKAIAPQYDQLVVYDKIDGYWRQPKPVKGIRFTQEIGKISKRLTAAIAKKNKNVLNILREDEAIKYVANNSQAGDVVVFIVNDDIKRSLSFMEKYFKVAKE